MITLIQDFFQHLSPARSLEETLKQKPQLQKCLPIAIGKASAGLVEVLKEHFYEAYFYTAPNYLNKKPSFGQWIMGDHPNPTKQSFHAGRHLLALASQTRKEGLVILSGGGSSIVEVPLEPFFQEEDIQEIHHHLLHSPLSIHEINCIRKHISAIKGGRLAKAFSKPVHTLIFSDVGKNHPDMVASGLTLPDPSTKEDGIKILQELRKEGWVQRLIPLFQDPIFPETPKPGDPDFAEHTWEVLMDNENALLILKSFLERKGLALKIFLANGDLPLQTLVDRLLLKLPLQKSHGLLWGGEFTYAVPSGAPPGGRCLHLLLTLILHLKEKGYKGWHLLGLATDGHDGTAPVAGGWATQKEGDALAVQVLKEAWESFNAYALFKKHFHLVPAQATGANFRDVFALWFA